MMSTMDFGLGEDREGLRDLAREILAHHGSPDGLTLAEETGFHRDGWQALAEAGLLGMALPERVGGLGLGFVDVCLLLEQVGYHVMPVPVLSSLVCGALPMVHFGSPELQELWLPKVATGETILTGAWSDARNGEPGGPGLQAQETADGWVLQGRKAFVPAVEICSGIVVSGVSDAGVGLWVCDPGRPGLQMERAISTNFEVLHHLEFDSVLVGPADVVVAPGEDESALATVLGHVRIGVAAMALGVARRALEMLASHARTREQFGRPIGAFQAVSQRAGDAYIDLQAMELTLWQAAWLLAEGRPAEREIAIAKYWAAEGASRITLAAQHIHGGMGFDRDFPLYRYTLWARALEYILGGPSSQLEALGEIRARI